MQVGKAYIKPSTYIEPRDICCNVSSNTFYKNMDFCGWRRKKKNTTWKAL